MYPKPFRSVLQIGDQTRCARCEVNENVHHGRWGQFWLGKESFSEPGWIERRLPSFLSTHSLAFVKKVDTPRLCGVRKGRYMEMTELAILSADKHREYRP